jgi:ceramide glucosyltransferase
MIHIVSNTIQIVAALGCLSSSIYYMLCLWSAVRLVRLREESGRVPASGFLPPVTILKPLKGIDPEIYESFRSHCLQDYPEYEIIFGVSDPADPAVESVERLKREFPDRAIQLVVCPQVLGTNVKVSNLEQMVHVARYQHLLVNDSDIKVDRDYLKKVISPLEDEGVGMVTCLYRGVPAATLGSRLESLGISSDFCPSVLVAQQVEGGIRFGLGSTLAFRRADLSKIGSFISIVDYLADDYELGARIAGLGKKVVLSDTVVETHVPAYDLKGFLAHQMRWARGVRDARLGGYIGLILTFGLMWASLALIGSGAAAWSGVVLLVIILFRVAVALVVGGRALSDRYAVSQVWLLPLRDLFAVGVWLASFAGHTVTWRGDRFELKNGRLTRIAP